MAPARTISIESACLRDHATLIRERIGDALDSIEQRLPIGPIRIRVSGPPSDIGIGFGLVGYAPDGRVMRVWVDPDRGGIAEVEGDRLLSLLAHESHHVMRWRDAEGHGSTLLGALIAEGLADHFAAMFCDQPVNNDSHLVAQLASRALEFGNSRFTMADYRQWFLGDEQLDLPPYGAYALAVAVVGHFLAHHPGSDAACLYARPHEAFRSSLFALA